MSAKAFAPMRVVSLLPSATEILCTAGGAKLLVGRSHECDYPSNITHLPQLTGQVHKFLSSRQMNDDVSASLASGNGLYTIDSRAIEDLRPDVILTQSLCNVCSVDLCMVERIAVDLDPKPQIMSLNPYSLQDVIDDVLKVGRVLGTEETGAAAVNAMQSRINRCLELVADKKAQHDPSQPPIKVAFVEWLDPIFVGGHWTPALIEMAGASHSLNPATGSGPSAAAGKSFAVSHQAMIDLDPDIIIISPCGLGLQDTHNEAVSMFKAEWWRGLRAVQSRRVAIVDGNQMFNRPGPRLVDALEFLTGLLNDKPGFIPEGFPWEWWNPHESLAAGSTARSTCPADNRSCDKQQVSQDGKNVKLTPHPPLPADIEDAYQMAMSKGSQTYTDPTSGYMVTTDLQQRDRGWCCGNRCRHCPYGHFNVDTELYGSRLNRITAPIHLRPHREPTGSDCTLLVWLGGLESHLAMTAMLQGTAAASDVVLVVATEAAPVQRTWGNDSLSLHDTLQQSKKLGVHMVVIPLEEELLSADHGTVCLEVLKRAAKLLQGTSCRVAYPCNGLPQVGSKAGDRLRCWSEVCSAGEFSDATSTEACIDGGGGVVNSSNWSEVFQASHVYRPLLYSNGSYCFGNESNVKYDVVHTSIPNDLPIGAINIQSDEGTAIPAWDPVGIAVASSLGKAFVKVKYV